MASNKKVGTEFEEYSKYYLFVATGKRFVSYSQFTQKEYFKLPQNDKGVDLVEVDNIAKKITVVQCKYRSGAAKSISFSADKLSHVLAAKEPFTSSQAYRDGYSMDIWVTTNVSKCSGLGDSVRVFADIQFKPLTISIAEEQNASSSALMSTENEDEAAPKSATIKQAAKQAVAKPGVKKPAKITAKRVGKTVIQTTSTQSSKPIIDLDKIPQILPENFIIGNEFRRWLYDIRYYMQNRNTTEMPSYPKVQHKWFSKFIEMTDRVIKGDITDIPEDEAIDFTDDIPSFFVGLAYTNLIDLYKEEIQWEMYVRYQIDELKPVLRAAIKKEFSRYPDLVYLQ